MPDLTPTIVLVHGAFAESASWAPVVEELRSGGVRVVAAANPLRSLASDAAYVRDVIGRLGDPVVLVGHSYGGMVVTEAAAGNASVLGLVYVAGLAPDHGESAFGLARRFPGSTLADALVAYPIAAGGAEVAIRQDAFHQQFAADLPEGQAAVMAATQRPVTRVALAGGLVAEPPAWRELPSWFVFGDGDRVVPVEAHRYMAERAAAKVSRELAGASHALSLSESDAVTATILEATASL